MHCLPDSLLYRYLQNLLQNRREYKRGRNALHFPAMRHIVILPKNVPHGGADGQGFSPRTRDK
jgi:hypothetical protein